MLTRILLQKKLFPVISNISPAWHYYQKREKRFAPPCRIQSSATCTCLSSVQKIYNAPLVAYVKVVWQVRHFFHQKANNVISLVVVMWLQNSFLEIIPHCHVSHGACDGSKPKRARQKLSIHFYEYCPRTSVLQFPVNMLRRNKASFDKRKVAQFLF